MGSLKSGLFAVALTSLVGTAAVVGCSADGGSGITDTTGTTDPTDPGPVDDGTGKLPPSSSSGNPAPTDAGAKDASKKDSGPKPEAGVDAGPPPPVVGAVCPTLNVTASKSCGKCGKAETVCLDDGTGKGKWSPYGACSGEVGDCTPGESVSEDCGNCGKQVKTCNQYCAFTTSMCTGQPVNNCKSGTTEYSGAGCVTPQTYRNRSCGVACTWSNYSATCETPVNDLKLDIGAAAGATTSKTIAFSSAKVTSRLSAFSTCPLASAPTAGNYPYQYVEVHNPSATKAAKVTIYASPAPGGVVIDTIMAAYATSIQPMDDAARKACAFGVNDQSSADIALTTDADFSILKAVAIPAGGSVLVYVASYYVDGSAGNVTTGNLNINTLIETLN